MKGSDAEMNEEIKQHNQKACCWMRIGPKHRTEIFRNQRPRTEWQRSNPSGSDTPIGIIHHCIFITASSSLYQQHCIIITASSSLHHHHCVIITAASSLHHHDCSIITAASS
jgi:hypothetical protein